MSPPTETELVASLLERVSGALGLDADVAVSVDADGELRGTLEGDDLGLFIGRHGQTIDAVQHLARRVVHTQTGELRRVVVDAEGYRARREESLRRQADQASEGALSAGRPVAMVAMTASERRVVHEYLRDRIDVATHSEGDEPDRHLVVAPVAAAE